jgi:hypothetical protein
MELIRYLDWKIERKIVLWKKIQGSGTLKLTMAIPLIGQEHSGPDSSPCVFQARAEAGKVARACRRWAHALEALGRGKGVSSFPSPAAPPASFLLPPAIFPASSRAWNRVFRPRFKQSNIETTENESVAARYADINGTETGVCLVYIHSTFIIYHTCPMGTESVMPCLKWSIPPMIAKHPVTPQDKCWIVSDDAWHDQSSPIGSGLLSVIPSLTQNCSFVLTTNPFPGTEKSRSL